MWHIGEPGGEAIRSFYAKHPNLRPNSSHQLLITLESAARKLLLPLGECETALNLAECLRISNATAGQTTGYPPCLRPYAEPLKLIEPLPVRAGKKGTTMPEYSPKEHLVLLALYYVSPTLPVAAGLFAHISVRSEDSAKNAMSNLQKKLSK